MRKLIKPLLIAWFVNAGVLTASYFLRSYHMHHETWAALAWENVMFTSIMTKCAITLCLFGMLMEQLGNESNA